MTKRSAASRYARAVKHAVLKDFPFFLAHEACGANVAFYLRKMPEEGKPLLPQDAMYPNGDMPKQGDPACCFTCKAELMHTDLDPLHVRRVQ